MSEELVEALWRQLEMMQTALTQAVVGDTRVVTSSGKEFYIVTHSCPLPLTVETSWGPVGLTMPFTVLRRWGDVIVSSGRRLGGTSWRSTLWPS